jgi:hypothetical protein
MMGFPSRDKLDRLTVMGVSLGRGEYEGGNQGRDLVPRRCGLSRAA